MAVAALYRSTGDERRDGEKNIKLADDVMALVKQRAEGRRLNASALDREAVRAVCVKLPPHRQVRPTVPRRLHLEFGFFVGQ
jgi:hypothetical protein